MHRGGPSLTCGISSSVERPSAFMTSFNLALRRTVNKRWRGRDGKHGEKKGEALLCTLNVSWGSQLRSAEYLFSHG